MRGRPHMDYFASAPRGTWGTWDGRTARVPYGTHHARRLGSAESACGAPAMDWELFWDVDFAPALEASCRPCARAILPAR
ncbi:MULTISPECIES: hypothetical protein [Aeromicrobium]|uniref:hypothetical protein n=1 Tax=Aeromicrobium TaxID=2040 RepID=UPI00257E893E|nr:MULTISPECIES: hypothetical protein [Aeromicrobium]